MHGYPRPQLRRGGATNLNGPWLFAIDREALWRAPEQVRWAGPIEVPFAPETPASGVGDTRFFRACWYRRAVRIAKPPPDRRILLHFGAVDFAATVWVNGKLAATHEGGYTPFSADITELLHPSGHQLSETQTIVVRAEDDPHDLSQPRGKQDWQLEPHAIWYPRTTGIWQTVWVEQAPVTRIGSVRWSSDLQWFEICLDARIEGARREGLRLRVLLSRRDEVVVDDTYSVEGEHVSRRIGLPDPGIDAERNPWLWWPSQPTLIDARLELLDEQGRVVDVVDSYTAMRAVGIHGDRFLLNGRPYRLRMALDQGYWPETGLTAPDDDALRRDVELAKAMGFNGVRKHQKIEDPRYLYWADRLGLLVWEEMPSAYAFNETAMLRLTREWTAAIERDRSHPCIAAWVPFNESWGLPDLASSAQQRDYAEAVFRLTRALDPSRPVITNDGWEAPATDIVGLHDYEQDAAALDSRYGTPDALAAMLARGRVAGRRTILAGQREHDGPVMLTEFGGMALSDDPGGTWGYSRCTTAEELADRYAELLSAVRAVPGFSGFCYTQFTDCYQETNGLLYADRRPKVPLEVIAKATRGQ
ncbi:MAG: glycoside hydrolase family 2 [Chloroflexi bacterium]|nr:glycoside hydrolase family 2 [Chloroflexota bacterium]